MKSLHDLHDAATENLVHFSFSCTFFVEGDHLLGEYYSFQFLNILKCINIFFKVTNKQVVKGSAHGSFNTGQ